MKITPEIIDNFHITKCFYYDACKECGEPYIGQRYSKGYCSKYCNWKNNSKLNDVSGSKNGFYNKHHTVESKKKNSEWHIGKYPSEETRKKYSINNSGSGNPNWKGGTYTYGSYPPLWQKIRKSIIIRDNNNCQNPYCEGIISNRICVHHIDYNKYNCNENNLILLCNSCHIKSNSNRNLHKMFYNDIIYKKSSGGTLTAKEINC